MYKYKYIKEKVFWSISNIYFCGTTLKALTERFVTNCESKLLYKTPLFLHLIYTNMQTLLICNSLYSLKESQI